MTQDLQQYADIIEQLKPMVNEPEFNQVLTQVAGGLPKEKRFLIKMEVKRLARPCMRSIDLRGQVDGNCQLYEYDGIKHYLDDIAIDMFEQQIRVFGHYSFGVYEAVQQTENNYRVMRERAESSQQQSEQGGQSSKSTHTMARFSVPVVNLLDYSRRDTERMNFAVALEIFNESNHSIRGISVDVSTEGIQVKLSKESLFKTGEKVFIYFRGLEDEFAMDKKNGIAYTVVKIGRKKDIQYLSLRRAKEFPNPAFDKFLESFIHGNKRRYKVNMANTIDAIRNKSCEQYFSPRCPTLPVYIDDINGSPVPRYAMANEVNREILHYWSDEQDESRLGFLLNSKRLAALLQKKADRRELFVYSFTHLQNEKVYFYSASADELADKDVLRGAFLGFGSRKASWRIFKLTMTDMSPDQAHAPLSIPDSVSSKIKRQNTPPAPRLMSKLKNLRYLVHITDVTSDAGQRRYSEYKFNRNNLSHLRVFGHPRNRVPQEIPIFRFKSQDKRLESRYLLRSNIELRMHVDGRPVKGVSEDISVHGLRLELNGEFTGQIDDRVTVSFPKLQELTSKHDVMSLQYDVVHFNPDRNIVHLKSAHGEPGQSARHFFDDLIKQNRNTLKSYPEEEEIPGIGHALRIINARNVMSLSFLLSKDGVRYKPEASIIGKQDDRVSRLASHFGGKDEVNLEFMFRDRNLDSPFVQHGIKQVKVENLPIRQEVFIAFDPAQKDSRMAIIPRFDNQFTSDDTRHNFIKEAMGRGQFIALHVMLTTTGKPDLDMLQAEINYVSVYAIHRAKELEEKLWSIAACSHLVDITDEVMMRYNFEPAEIARNRENTAQHVIEPNGIQALLRA
ncbi:PilZ domain-containing protein [Alteromonas sp. ASW11-19]|uniref:PilZ domain-containing protein n=1 Tax=Alteromonas salexigens TaxID=2982530 RepID=A0ABT2VS66_9ALTE|nr:PilZ domain-containing protein [Alteromonas salexigens]MCU7555752.1 PilZ domain-containing protein [Alteromonas salexigens]